MTTRHNPRIRVVLFKPKAHPAFICLAQRVAAAISANPTTFPAPTPGMTQLGSDIAALVAAQIAVATRTKGAVEARDARRARVDRDLIDLRAYVEGVANADLPHAAAIAMAAGMGVAKPRRARRRNDVDARPGALSGTLVVTARVGTRQKQSHEWAYSTDGGATWVGMLATTQAKTRIAGLTPGSVVVVRHRAITATGPTRWSWTQPRVVT